MEAVAADVLIFSEFAAQTYARAMVEVRGHVEGYIEKWNFCPAAEVTAGQTLYVLDLRPYTAAVQQAKGNLHQSEADLEFARKQVVLLQAQANLASAGSKPGQGPAGCRSSHSTGAARRRIPAGAGRRGSRSEGESGERRCLESHRRAGQPDHAHADRLHAGEGGCAEQDLLVQALARATRLSTLRYQGGADSYLRVLSAERDLFQGQLTQAQLRLEELLACVYLNRALGGGLT
jgi:multidrug resistance efflux pump